MSSRAASKMRADANATLPVISPLLRDWDLSPECPVGIDLISDDERKSDDKPHDPDLQAIGVGARVEDCEAVCRVGRRDQDVGITTPGNTSEQRKYEQAR